MLFICRIKRESEEKSVSTGKLIMMTMMMMMLIGNKAARLTRQTFAW